MLRLLKTGRARLAGVLSVALLGVSLPLSLIGAANADVVPSELKIRWKPERTVFAGRVKSEVEECLPNRLVTVFKVREGPDKQVGSDLTDSLGRWRVNRRHAKGRFYARIGRVGVGVYYGQGDTCGGARSKTIEVPEGDDD
jgi:hypothetical protein